MKKIFFALMLALASLSTQVQAQITAPVVEARPDTDPKYMQGAVPMVDGHAVLVRHLDVNASLSQEEVKQKMDSWLTRCMNDERVRWNQRLEEVNPNQLQHHVTLELTFSKSFIAHDFADLSFVLILDATEAGKVTMTMTRINFRYNEGNKTVKYAGEELIADSVAFTKKGKLVFGYKKYRIKTIDLMDELSVSLQKELQ